jgi:ABC-type Fe3+ transport system permease subunit
MFRHCRKRPPNRVLGTLTAIGLSDPKFPARRFVVPLLISPLIVPVVVTAVGTYLFYARVGLAGTYVGIILAHTVLASPFVVVTVGASLTGFDRNLMRATSILGAKPLTGFFRVMLPHILPGVLSGAAFAFVTSFEVVVVQLLANAAQRTLPLEMFTGLREQLSPAITAAATLMMGLSSLLLIVANSLARRSRRIAGAVQEQRSSRSPSFELLDKKNPLIATRQAAQGIAACPTRRRSTARAGFFPISRRCSPRPRRPAPAMRLPASRRRARSSASPPRWRWPISPSRPSWTSIFAL